MGLRDWLRRRRGGDETPPKPEPETYVIGGVTFTLAEAGHFVTNVLFDAQDATTAQKVNTLLERALRQGNYAPDLGIIKANPARIQFLMGSAADASAANLKQQLTTDALRENLVRFARAYPTAEMLDVKIQEGALGTGAAKEGRQTALARRDTKPYLDAVTTTLSDAGIPVNDDLRSKLEDALITAHMGRGA